MPEHRIRLRGGWERHEPVGGAAAPAARLTLPIDWPASGGAGPRVRLARSFHRPPFNPDAEILTLRLDDVPGLLLATLNDRPIPLPGPGGRSTKVALGADLPERNRLVLDVEPPGEGGGPWGSVALEIRSKGDDPGEVGPLGGGSECS